MRLSEMTIQKLSLSETRQQHHADDILPGFGIRVSQGRSKKAEQRLRHEPPTLDTNGGRQREPSASVLLRRFIALSSQR
jgi:hypothetical protein